MTIVLLTFPVWYLDFMYLKVASRYRHFTVEITSCNCKVYSNNFFSRTSYLLNSFSGFPVKYNFQKFKYINRHFLSIFLIPFFYWPLYEITFFQFLSFSIATCVLVVLSHWMGWNDKKKTCSKTIKTFLLAKRLVDIKLIVNKFISFGNKFSSIWIRSNVNVILC